MALAPAFAAHRVFGAPTAPHTLELYLDYVCPFSAKQLKGVNEVLIPMLKEKGKEGAVSIIIRQTPQPWHHSSTLVHQAGIAVARLAPQKFASFSAALMAGQTDFFDEPTVVETPNQTKERLADLAAKSVGVDKAAFLELVKSGKGNGGTKVDAELKLAVKYGRQNGVHVTPTVALDGLVDPSVSSSFGKDEWCKYVDEKLI